MQLKNEFLWSMLAVVLTFFPMDKSVAYYDHGVQRWINRDPIADLGGNALQSLPKLAQLNGIRESLAVEESITLPVNHLLELADGPNVYAALRNNPLNMVDRFGQDVRIHYKCPLNLGPYNCQITGPLNWWKATCNATKLGPCLSKAVALMNIGCTVLNDDIFAIGCYYATACLIKYAT